MTTPVMRKNNPQPQYHKHPLPQHLDNLDHPDKAQLSPATPIIATVPPVPRVPPPVTPMSTKTVELKAALPADFSGEPAEATVTP
jgi:hypothetical protein